MTRRVAALFALFAFAAAWLVGVWCGHAPLTRLVNAAIALASGFCAGLGVGVALERIVLARLSDQWRNPEMAEAPSPSSAPAVSSAAAKAPAAATADKNDVEAVAAIGEARR